MDDKLIIQKDRNPKKGAPMLNHDLNLAHPVAAKTPQLNVPPPRAARPEGWLDPGRFLTPLGHAIASWHHQPHQGGSQVIIRFKNGYGAIIS
jgi:hypothetical protein